MAKTAAERQAHYRNGRSMAGESGERRINTWVSTGAHMALNRLAKRYGVTKREMLEKLISEADGKIKDTLNTDEQWDAYFDVTQ
jgi:hypothetical protein